MVTKEKFAHQIARFESNRLIRSVRAGLTMAIPVLIIGSFSLLIRTFTQPIAQLSWIAGTATLIYDCTFGILAILMTGFLALGYMQNHPETDNAWAAPAIAIPVFIILSGGMNMDYFGARGMFTAIVSGLGSSALYCLLQKKVPWEKLFTPGGDLNFSRALAVLWPTLTIILSAALFNEGLRLIFHAASFQELFIHLNEVIFHSLGRGWLGSALFVMMAGVLWLCGIHGTDVLENIALSLFAPGMDINLAAAAQGLPGTEIFTKTFLDLFVFMGGCGTLICLLIALLLFSRQKASRGLARSALVPMLFNVNELLVFGLPVVLNPIFVIPFLLTPLVCLLTSGAAMSLGWVPVCVQNVEWTMPVLFSGAMATGSWQGSVLQLVNILIGTAIYIPFVRLHDELLDENTRQQVRELTALMKNCEETGQFVRLVDQDHYLGQTAKLLAIELKNMMEQGNLTLGYQPQFDERGHCFGAEALLRAEHPHFGRLYPPLVIELARETGFLTDMELAIVGQVIAALPELPGLCLSVNITADTLRDERFEEFLKEQIRHQKIEPGTLWLEVTEQTTLYLNEEIEKKLERIKALGVLLAVDDFSMGSTSLKYLQSNQFSQVKLDGSLIRTLESNGHSRQIISSILYLSQSMDFEVIAEFVETVQQRDALRALGCRYYQGWLYSPAVPLEELKAQLKSEGSPAAIAI